MKYRPGHVHNNFRFLNKIENNLTAVVTSRISADRAEIVNWGPQMCPRTIKMLTSTLCLAPTCTRMSSLTHRLPQNTPYEAVCM
jgi:hypothetical protein